VSTPLDETGFELLSAPEGWIDIDALNLGQVYRKLNTRVVLVRAADVTDAPRIRGSQDVYKHFRALSQLDRECFAVILLDTKNRATGFQVVSVGCLQGTPVHPREVFKSAMLANAASIIAIHNHPSGDPTPSAEDRAVTERLRACGELLGIPLTDHVIVASDGYWSLVETNDKTALA
jgi:DNA repair protein RadC